MGLIEPENQNIHRYPPAHADDIDMDFDVCLSTAGVLEIPVEAEEKHAENTSFITA